MKAAVLKPTLGICYEPNYEIPCPRLDEVLLRVTLAGICGTDHEIVDGYKGIRAPDILGHEFVSIIVRFGHGEDHDRRDNGDFHIGHRVVAEINCVSSIECGSSETLCAAQLAHHRLRSVVGILDRNGAFAQYVCVPIQNLHHVPDDLSNLDALFIEPVAAACRILEQVSIHPKAKIAVVGSGRLGVLVAQVLSTIPLLRPPTIFTRDTVLEHVERRLTCCCSFNDHIEECVDEFDIVIDCTGSPSGLNRSLSIVRPKGTVILKSTTHVRDVPVEWSKIVIKEIKLLGSRCGAGLFPLAVHMLKTKKVRTDVLKQMTFKIEDIAAAFACSKNQRGVKCIVDIT